MRVDELRQHREHEDHRLGIAGVDQETTQHQGQRSPQRPFAIGAQGLWRRLPLAHRQVHQVGHAEPLDQAESQCRGRQQRTDAGGDNGDLQGQADLQAQRVPVASRKAVLQPAGHRGDGSGARRQADGPAGEKEGEPGTDEHCTPRKANAAGGGNEKASVHQGGAAAQVFRPRASPNLCGRNLADRKNPADAGLSRGYALSHVGQTTAMRLFALAPNALSPANPCAASPALRRACAPGLRASGCSAPPPPGRRPWRSRRSLSARALRRTRPPARCRPR